MGANRFTTDGGEAVEVAPRTMDHRKVIVDWVGDARASRHMDRLFFAKSNGIGLWCEAVGIPRHLRKKYACQKLSAQTLRFEVLEPRHLLAGVVINEFHSNPDVPTEQVEFIELYNSDAQAVDLSGWRIDEAVDYTFPDGTVLGPSEYLVITENLAEFASKFGFAAFGEWEEGDKLNNEGETIELIDASGQLVDTVDYQLGFPWPTVGDHGNSLELINPAFDNDLSGNWRSSGTREAAQQLVPESSVWRYRKGLFNNPPSGWNDIGFDEGSDNVAWQSGQATLGYGDGDDTTVLSDMLNNYSSIYLRHEFTITDPIPNALLLHLYVDDGAVIFINGEEVERAHVTPGSKSYDSFPGESHEAEWEEIVLDNLGSLLVPGQNVLAIHALNQGSGSSDFSFNAALDMGGGASPTPGAQNSVFSENAAPLMRQLNQSVEQPTSGQDVTITIKVTDPDGVQDVSLEYQLVDPGDYIRLTDTAYDTNWTSLQMHDDGLNGDAAAGDDIFSVVLPGSLHTHRRLVRYRINLTDTLGATVRGPYADDPQPNFAYFVYDGVPDYTGSLRPGVEPIETYSGDVLDDIATYHLIAAAQDVQNSQYNSAFNEVLFKGTFVYNGVVYDHIDFRNRGVASTYQVGKNKWKLEFLRGHFLQAHDNYGNPYATQWDEINVLPGTNPWWRDNVSTEGTVLFEPAAFKLYELTGTPSSNTHYFQFRVIDGASEFGTSQYGGDFWGLYIGIEQPDGRFLDERGLPDGNIFNMHGGAFGSTTQRTQGSELPDDRSDLVDFLSGIDGGFETLQWWEENLNFDSYFAWNIINHVVNNSDIRPDENVNYYHNQESGQWYILPWDLDLTFEDRPHLGNPVTNREDIQTLMEDHPLARLAYENRLREVVDLLLDSDDAALVVEELANILTFGGTDESILLANQAQWDYHPRKNKPGIWYENFNPALLPSEDFTGLVTYMQDFVSPGGYGYDLLLTRGDDGGIPNRPVISYVGEPNFAADGLVFETTPFSDPQGAGTFGAMEWRVAEVHNSSVANFDPSQPYIYEIEGGWESGETSVFDNQIEIPGTAVTPGKTYRARVRLQDDDGHWSHWSDPIEFLVTVPVELPTLTITELHYHPNKPELLDEDDLEFIEIFNFGAATVDLAGLQITAFASTPYVLADGLSLEPGGYIIVARSPAAFQAEYGTHIAVAPDGYGDANLSNGGETIALRTASGFLIESFTYDDASPWPTAADGDGASLEIIDPLGDHNDPLNWRASISNGGSPGRASHQMLVGDFNDDGFVNAADYIVWRNTRDQVVTPFSGADADGSGVVDDGDYQLWREHYGESLATGVSVVSASASASPKIIARIELETSATEQVSAPSAEESAVIRTSSETVDDDALARVYADVFGMPSPTFASRVGRNIRVPRGNGIAPDRHSDLLLVLAENWVSRRDDPSTEHRRNDVFDEAHHAPIRRPPLASAATPNLLLDTSVCRH